MPQAFDLLSGGAINVQYSVDGATNWHATFTAGDIYMRQLVGANSWSAAIRIVGATGTAGAAGSAGATGAPGPGVVFRGIYSPSTVYYQTAARIDIVSYGGTYYYTNNAAKSGTATWGTPGTGDWSAFGATFDSVATKLLLATDALITSADIGALQVATLNIADNAVTFPVIVYTEGSIGTMIPPCVIQSATITTTGGRVEINAACIFSSSGDGGYTGAMAGFSVELKRVTALGVGTILATFPLGMAAASTLAFSFPVVDTPPAGTYTYQLILLPENPNDEVGVEDITNRLLAVQEVKK